MRMGKKDSKGKGRTRVFVVDSALAGAWEMAGVEAREKMTAVNA